ncbi:hypothetical protein BAUCODRAFT_119783 [Baudoinia panamericana UAMH 10762]|uniref:Peptidase S53 domain-containing protein n=1 Tax=Baudoinia panamericana (strain UAMH 10762) TaxID=717646 RepID=M2N7Z3_BAUPA|nr:uncharacterized protein BAUCODRAFT_119783 [Baudoinia panamericana UAMH 10762]EMD00234.1 hypothetical protein BAUCODRAFT_119783 [Baudoinia panamericana UAMH 10762]
MHFLFLSFIAAAVWGFAQARVVPASHLLHEKREHAGTGNWVKRARTAPHVKVPVRIGLRQNQYALSQAQQWLMNVSHPGSENYGQHWTQEDVINTFAPSDDSTVAVKEWLATALPSREITHTKNKAWLAFDATVQELENLVHAEYYEHHNGDRAMISCEKYHVPASVKEHIDYITPGVKGVHFESKDLKKRSRRPNQDGSGYASRNGRQPPQIRPAINTPLQQDQLDTCDQIITPACLQALYDFEPLPPNATISPNNSLGVFEEGDYYSQADLDSFFTNFTSYIPNGTHPVLDSIDGGMAPVVISLSGGESDLDFQLAIPVIYPQTTTLFQTDDTYYGLQLDPNVTGIFNTFLDAIDGSYCTYSAYGETGDDPILDPVYPDPNLPPPNGYQGQRQCGVYAPTNVISISYGEQEEDLPAYYQQRQCNEFLKLGLQGVSIFVASGDTGVGGLAGHGSANGCLRNGTVFSPTHPNSCPWLTNVGATKVYPGRTVYEPESAANDPAGHPYHNAFSSSGGFSNIFTVPDYQAFAVQTYFADHNPPYPYYNDGQYNTSDGLYNRNGRGIPDVAANGDNIAVYARGRLATQGGTSASAPIFAALVTRINEERISAGKGPIGFINPVLYQHPEILNDIVNGTNPGCGTSGFDAVPGWDPVTGLGTPNYPKMLSLFMSLP